MHGPAGFGREFCAERRGKVNCADVGQVSWAPGDEPVKRVLDPGAVPSYTTGFGELREYPVDACRHANASRVGTLGHSDHFGDADIRPRLPPAFRVPTILSCYSLAFSDISGMGQTAQPPKETRSLFTFVA